VTILLSKLIKSTYTSQEKLKAIQIRLLQKDLFSEGADPEHLTVLPEKHAHEIIEDAKREAKRIIQDCEEQVKHTQFQMEQKEAKLDQKVQNAISQGKDEGYRDGFETGNEDGKKQYEALLQQASSIVDKSKADYKSRVEQAEPLILELAIKAAEKIIHASLEQERERWNGFVQEVVKEVKDQQEARLYVHPSSYELTLARKNELKNMLNAPIYIYPDGQLSEYGCIVESSFGKIDASIDSQLSELRKKLLEKLQET
jgi:flagellar assembly protein FliH